MNSASSGWAKITSALSNGTRASVPRAGTPPDAPAAR
jgi:hypothetical protein